MRKMTCMEFLINVPDSYISGGGGRFTPLRGNAERCDVELTDTETFFAYAD